MNRILTLGLLLVGLLSFGQTASINGVVTAEGLPMPYANVYVVGQEIGSATDADGRFSLDAVIPGKVEVRVSVVGFTPYRKVFQLKEGAQKTLDIVLVEMAESLNETVVTGTLKPVNVLESPVPVSVYSPTFLKKNPTPSLFESLQNVNGVRPQINCNVCNTGDIHINGLEGPYTLVLIDGMPIVSGLGTVYGLTGIPTSLIQQIEVVKGPASSLYGSEAVGGLINVITKHAVEAPKLAAEAMASGWGEYNLDLAGKFGIQDKVDVLVGANYFNYDNPIDDNGDNFTDLTLQDRISVFSKWNFKRDNAREFSLAGRFFYEDRWGGELQWTPEFRGGDEIYGESIFTRRWELIGKYQLPLEEKMLLSVSYNDHHQNSFYGDVPYLADQRIGFAQLTWDKKVGKHDLLAGTALRYNFYDDNTTATSLANNNEADEAWIPGVFVQDELEVAKGHTLLLGSRFDYDDRHGGIFTPRAAYKWKITDFDVLRFNFGTGFRVVNLFTEDHAALTGSRDVIIAEDLDPERSINFNLNYLKKIHSSNGWFLGLEASAFYTNFSNQILPDYDTDPNQIIYDNLDGKSVSQGFSGNVNLVMPNGLRAILGATWQDVQQEENGVKQRQILTERFSGTWSISYPIKNWDLLIDYTGNIYGPMRLPLLGDLDPRQPFSPTWSIQNIQFTYQGIKGTEIYAGAKNLLDWTPNRGNPFIIARADDPFDRNVQFDNNGNVIATVDNPFALTFDPSYVYGPNQGIRGFVGIRYNIQ